MECRSTVAHRKKAIDSREESIELHDLGRRRQESNDNGGPMNGALIVIERDIEGGRRSIRVPLNGAQSEGENEDREEVEQTDRQTTKMPVIESDWKAQRLFLRPIPLDLANLNNSGFVRLPNGAEGPRAPERAVITLIPLPPPPPPPPPPCHPIPRLSAPARLIAMGRDFGKGPTILPWATFIIFTAVVADNYHYHSHGQDNRDFEATMLAAGVALLAFIAYILSNLYDCICK
ncbi:hypothetical protein DFP72DRAFT_860121 [Ephemerocybe angulata]|uniref:Uncharacterized protein n=1 Tax=Ephemerocybe angulata TaxID=980116 RepID=A0A8H6HA74_9AGAR|nr:hypothetical protein DFP72DRAFT_860121 [Tulosesus angulatus]